MVRRRTFGINKSFVFAIFIALIGVVAVSVVGHAMHRDVAGCSDPAVACDFP